MRTPLVNTLGRYPSPSARWLQIGAAWLAAASGGCGTNPTGSSASSSQPATAEFEPNDSFAQAKEADFDSAKIARMVGTIDGSNDLDVYDLGPMQPGDQIHVRVESLTDRFDPSIALFDQDLNLFIDNDDIDLDTLQFDSSVDEIVRHAGDPYYLVVGRSAAALSASPASGDYHVTVRIFAASRVPSPKAQVLLLDFDGGEVEPDNLFVKEVRPFDAAAIDPVFAGQDQVIRQSIIDTMVENFADFDVPVVDDPADLPPNGEFTTVMFGSRSVRAFGISESVDHYNGDLADVAIIFTESFTPDQFTRTPSAQELGIAIGNVASHEVGHLLGLNHVDDETALMDAVSPADTFVADQDFKIGPLSADILPIGNHNSPLLLSESVGLTPHASPPPVSAPVKRTAPRMRKPSALSWCGTCNRKLELLSGRSDSP